MITFTTIGSRLTTVLYVVSLGLAGCKDESRSMNESLRLSPSEIVEYRVRALSGDRESAKKLWHHYDAIEWNFEEGAKWRKIYEGKVEEEARHSE